MSEIMMLIERNNFAVIKNDIYKFFYQACRTGDKDMAEWICTINNNYKIIYENNKMIPYVLNIKTIISENLNNLEKLERLFENANIKKVIDDCMVCFNNENEYWIKLECNHEICAECFTKIEQCPYRCNNVINLYNIKLLKLIRN